MNDNIITLLELYFDEWKFRHENLWKRITQFCIIIFFISTFPISIRVFDGLIMPKIPLLIFPILGIALTAFFLFFCLSESSRINAIDQKIKMIIIDEFPKYAKNDLPSFNNEKAPQKAFSCFAGEWLFGFPAFYP